jgi:hypothetical protein
LILGWSVQNNQPVWIWRDLEEEQIFVWMFGGVVGSYPSGHFQLILRLNWAVTKKFKRPKLKCFGVAMIVFAKLSQSVI